jgi:hypothetical protein
MQQRPSMLKRQKERARIERRQEKAAIKEVRKAEKKARADAGLGPEEEVIPMGPFPQPSY